MSDHIGREITEKSGVIENEYGERITPKRDGSNMGDMNRPVQRNYQKRTSLPPRSTDPENFGRRNGQRAGQEQRDTSKILFPRSGGRVRGSFYTGSTNGTGTVRCRATGIPDREGG